MEDTSHYYFNFLNFLLNSSDIVALINLITTDMTRKMQLGVTKDDDLDGRLSCNVLASNLRRKGWRISKINCFDLYEQKRLIRKYHNLKEQLNRYTNKFQNCIDIVFPEFYDLFRSSMELFIWMFLEHLAVPMRLLMPTYAISAKFLKPMVERVLDCANTGEIERNGWELD